MLLPVFALLYNVNIWPVMGRLLLVIVLGTAGVVVTGTVFAALASQARMRELLLPLLLLPVLAPLLIASVEATGFLAERRAGARSHLDGVSGGLRRRFSHRVVAAVRTSDGGGDTAMELQIESAVFTAILIGCAGYAALFVAPDESTMHAIQRIFYFHAPTAWAGMDAFFDRLHRQHRLPGDQTHPSGTGSRLPPLRWGWFARPSCCSPGRSGRIRFGESGGLGTLG